MEIRYIKETNPRACKLSNSTQNVLPDLHLYRDVQRENKIRREETDGVRYILQKLWSNRVLDEEEMQKKTYKPKGLLQQNLPSFPSPFLPPSQYLWRCRWPARCEFSFILINNMSIYLSPGYASTSDSDVSFPWTHASLLNIASPGFGTCIAWLKSGNQNDLVYSSSVLKDSTYLIKLWDAMDGSIFYKDVGEMKIGDKYTRYFEGSESICSSSGITMEANGSKFGQGL